MNKKTLVIGAILAVVAIVLGAFGSHGLKESLSEASLKSFETGVRYQMYHAFFLLIVGGMTMLSDRQKRILRILVLVGVALFSVSIYLLSTTALHGIDFKSIGFLTPIGGLFLICSWVVFIVQILRYKIH